MPLNRLPALADYDKPEPPNSVWPPHTKHNFVPMRTIRYPKGSESIETITDVYCTECGHRKTLVEG